MLRLCTLAVVVALASAQSAQLRSLLSPRVEARSLQSTKSYSETAEKKKSTGVAKNMAAQNNRRKQSLDENDIERGEGGSSAAVVIPIVLGIIAIVSILAYCLYKKLKAEWQMEEDSRKEAEEKKKKEEEEEKRLKEEQEERRKIRGEQKEQELKNKWGSDENSSTTAASRQGTGDIPDLAPGWETVMDPASGKPYYYNRSTGVTQWTPPYAAVSAKAADTLPSGWQEVQDPASGKPYYYNQSTGVTQWTRPAAVVV